MVDGTFATLQYYTTNCEPEDFYYKSEKPPFLLNYCPVCGKKREV